MKTLACEMNPLLGGNGTLFWKTHWIATMNFE